MDNRCGSISIIVPVYNDTNGVSQTLGSLAKESSLSAEILVVDNGSTDNTRDLIRNYTDEHDNIRLLVEDEIQGSYAARNKGLKSTDSDILAFLDADETVDEAWLQKAIEAMNEQDVDYLGCNVELTLPRALDSTDETGAFVAGEASLAALATAELEPGDTTVAAVNVSQRLVDACERVGAELELTPIGSTNIITRGSRHRFSRRNCPATRASWLRT